MDHKLQSDRHRFLRWLYIGISGFLLLWVSFTPPDPFLDKPVVMAGLVAMVAYSLSWDEKRHDFRLPFQLPGFMILMIPLGLVTLTLLRTQWSSLGAADRIRWIWGFGPSSLYLISFSRWWLRRRQ